ncbi:glycine--tRNA ligase subunit beta [Desulfomicrobium escambiense]|uniref:glycine--tRNA ligase subunit beta n=1 Tax=Desulfomicrobium escambiense TaxID=29503 RepID=UPI0003FDADEC|nr:glycine--tRNA ligase subunit beta [Desulfomicrobium escambiense]
MSHFVLEIGVEEMPARFLPLLDRELRERFEALLGESGLEFGAVASFSTPRRLVVDITGLAGVQKTEEIVVSGPPVRIALDADGKPTKAGLGFAKSQNVEFDQVYVEKTDKGEYLALKKTVGGRVAADILAETCAAVLPSLTFPKKMQWIGKDCTFGRPVRWLLAMLDDRAVPFDFAGLTAGSETRGHRVMGPGPFAVPHADDYARVLLEQGRVVLDAAARRSAIRADGDRLAAEVGGTVEWSESLLDQVANLVEAPRAMLGGFHEKFLELPAEVLLTSMETHQKSFGLRGADGKLLPYFLTAANIESREPALVRKGWERVLRARLEDARFFWEADCAATFEQWLDKLDKVIFIGPLGTMGDKTRRLEKLAASIASRIAPELSADMGRAGRLSKADLVSEMVYEFDDLQGKMGGIYARMKGKGETVARALYEQYLPAGQDSPLPGSMAGVILSLADKLDNLAGCFGLGMMPTGAADPYALRRNALGVCRIVLEKGLTLDLAELLREAQVGYVGVEWKLPPEEALDKLMDFFGQRLRAYWNAQGVPTLVLEAAMAPGFGDIFETWRRVEALADFSREADFEASVLTFKRAANIIRKQAGQELSGEIRENLLEGDAEKAFWAALQAVEPEWARLAEAGDYPKMLALLGTLRPVVDAFFDGVMVMCDDAALRTNRLNLLQRLVSTLGRVADFGKFQV